MLLLRLCPPLRTILLRDKALAITMRPQGALRPSLGEWLESSAGAHSLVSPGAFQATGTNSTQMTPLGPRLDLNTAVCKQIAGSADAGCGAASVAIAAKCADCITRAMTLALELRARILGYALHSYTPCPAAACPPRLRIQEMKSARV